MDQLIFILVAVAGLWGVPTIAAELARAYRETTR